MTANTTGQARTEGQRALRATGASLKEIAQAAGISTAVASKLRAGKIRPGPRVRRTLAEYFGIPEASWGYLPGTSRFQHSEPPSVVLQIEAELARLRNTCGIGDWLLHRAILSAVAKHPRALASVRAELTALAPRRQARH